MTVCFTTELCRSTVPGAQLYVLFIFYTFSTVDPGRILGDGLLLESLRQVYCLVEQLSIFNISADSQ